MAKKSDKKKVRKHAFKFKGESMTKKSFAKECHTPVIIDRFLKTGILPGISQAEYGDQPEGDFQDAQLTMAKVKSSYENLSEEQKQVLPYELYVETLLTEENAPDDQQDTPVDTDRREGSEATSEASQSEATTTDEENNP